MKGQLDIKNFIERSNENCVVFECIYSNFHHLSNYYACPITHRKQHYRSLEHAYQHTKVLFFSHKESASRIKATRDSSEAKKISYELTGPRDVQRRRDEQRVELLTSLVKPKRDQNPSCVVKKLRATDHKIIAEFGRDKFYSTGLPITHRMYLLQGDKWTGKSNPGETLMNVRREMSNQDNHA